MYEKIYQHAACLRRDRWSAGLGLLPGGQWAVGNLTTPATVVITIALVGISTGELVDTTTLIVDR